MRTFVALSVLAALSLAAAAAAAQQPSAQNHAQTERAMSEIQVTAAQYKPVRAELDAITGIYELDDGATLRVARTNRRVKAALGQVGGVDLVPVGPYTYMARDRSLLVQFNLGTLGEDVLVTYNPDSVAAEQHGSAPSVATR